METLYLALLGSEKKATRKQHDKTPYQNGGRCYVCCRSFDPLTTEIFFVMLQCKE